MLAQCNDGIRQVVAFKKMTFSTRLIQNVHVLITDPFRKDRTNIVNSIMNIEVYQVRIKQSRGRNKTTYAVYMIL